MISLHEQLALEQERQRYSWGHIAHDRWRAVEQYAGNIVLDVGCSNGVYVNRLRDEGYRCYGIDFLRAQEWEQSGIFSNADARHLPLADNAVDTIISFETLEHIPNVEMALNEYHRVCKRNIIISVPNCETPDDFRLSGFTFHHWIDRTHINFFTMETVKKTVEEHDFHIVYAEPINVVYPAALFFNSLYIPFKVSRKFASFLNRIGTKNYFMSLLIVAEKR